MDRKYLFLSLSLCAALGVNADRVMHLPMEANKYGELTETVSNRWLDTYGKHYNENVAGAAGKALRFDGYSTYCQGNVASLGTPQKATFAMWVAPETYPVIKLDTPTDEKALLAGTINDDTKKGWGFKLGYTGKYSFRFYSDGTAGEIVAEDILPCYEWSHLVAVFDGENGKVTLYRNGQKVGEGNCQGTLSGDTSLLTVGKNPGPTSGDFALDTFNGVIDEIEVFDTALSANEIAAYTAENPADLTIPSTRFEKDLLRPKFHGMPGANWTNECHGMTYSNGRYHVFFQKNANGPYMTRLHWGHISSPNLYDWTEEKIAIAPAESYDVKGCWSGCVFTDDVVTGGKPNAIYTAVDYVKATIAQAAPADDDLIDWNKEGENPIINGRPGGLSDDFRDPYFFRNGDDAYIVVGTSKNSIGAMTLHKYSPSTESWSNDGKIFFQGNSAATDGRFWEMPTVTKMENGKWLVTATPLETATGVHVIYWTGSINADGTFAPDADSSVPREFELISRDGYGLLSPTIYKHDGKTIALGIVPDKVSTTQNCNWGWAHLYSFPRELSLDSNGNLLQKPFSGLNGLRSDSKVQMSNVGIDGVQDLDNVSGRQLELLGRFTVGSATVGFSFFKNSTGEAKVYYTPASNTLSVDLTELPRISNDSHVYNGLYRCQLPEVLPQGSELKLNVFVDGSVIDVFVNDKWATSVRAYPTAPDADGVAVFSNGGVVNAPEVSAWVLKSDGSAGIGDVAFDGVSNTFRNGPVRVFTLSGQLVKEASDEADAKEGLPQGIYLINNRKVLIE